MTRNLIWDVDGTLFDTYPAITEAFVAALADLGGHADPAHVEKLARISLSHCATVLADEASVDQEKLSDRFIQHYATRPLAQQSPFPGVLAVCRHILTNGGTHVIVTHRGWESTQRLLRAHRMTRYFADVVTRDDGCARKPDPFAFSMLMDKHRFDPEETLAIGDRDIDILAGRAAGIRTCLFSETGEANVIPDLLIRDFAELHAWLLAQEKTL